MAVETDPALALSWSAISGADLPHNLPRLLNRASFSRPTNVPENVFVVDEVPFDLLFPRMAAIVHHGGAGTIASAAAAGRPQVICPFVADQPFWGRLMQARGVAAAPIKQAQLTVDNLAAAITNAVTDPALAKAASQLGELVRTETGTLNAVERLASLATPLTQ